MIKPFVKKVVGASAKDSQGMLSSMLHDMQKDLMPMNKTLAASTKRIRGLLKMGAEKEEESDGFGLAISRRLDKLHDKLVEEDAEWHTFKKEMDAAESKHHKKLVLKAKASAKHDRASGAGDSKPSRTTVFKEKQKKQKQGGSRFLDDSSDSDGGMSKVVRAVKRDLLNLIPKDERPSSGCYACGGDHKFSHSCPKFEKARKKVNERKEAARKRSEL